MKKTIVLFLLVSILAMLSGCGRDDLPDDTYAAPRYSWIAGECPIPDRRTGLAIQGVMSSSNGFECTDSGVYFMCQTSQGDFLCYGDHDSDTIVKLCGRPDCTHSDITCNAYFNGGSNVCYYDGHLYVVQDMQTESLVKEVVRINLDGTDRTSVVNTKDISERLYGIAAPQIWNGVFSIILLTLDEQGNEVGQSYYYKLDGSMEKMELAQLGVPYKNAGDIFLSFSLMDNGKRRFYLWDPETQTHEILIDEIGVGYYGAEEAYYILDGVIYHLVYENNQTECMLDTGLRGYHALFCFPDCMVVSDYITGEDYLEGLWPEEITLYFYNWDYEYLGQVEIDYPREEMCVDVICGETPNRIILTDDTDLIPRYYIEKADFCTGNIEIHEYKLPDLEEQPLSDNSN